MVNRVDYKTRRGFKVSGGPGQICIMQNTEEQLTVVSSADEQVLRDQEFRPRPSSPTLTWA